MVPYCLNRVFVALLDSADLTDYSTFVGCYADSLFGRVFTDEWIDDDMTPSVTNGYIVHQVHFCCEVGNAF